MVVKQYPQGRLPRADRPPALSVVASVCVHALVIVLLIIVQRRPEPESARRPGLPGDAGGGGGITYIRIDAPPAAATPAAARAPEPEIIVPPPVQPVPVPVTVRKLDVPLPTGTVVAAAEGAGTDGSGGGAGGGHGAGLGTDSGPGTGGEGGEIFPPKPKYTILPPLPQPSSVRGKTFRVHFWVNAQGRVTRVRVEPEIRDAAYRRQFLDFMHEYAFEPARRQDGTTIDGEFDYVFTL
jgi:hypothetical protein